MWKWKSDYVDVPEREGSIVEGEGGSAACFMDRYGGLDCALPGYHASKDARFIVLSTPWQIFKNLICNRARLNYFTFSRAHIGFEINKIFIINVK